MKLRRLQALILFVLFSLIGCQQSNNVHPLTFSPSAIIPTGTFISIPSQTATVTLKPTITVTASPKHTPTITLTPLPTMRKDKIPAKFDQLYLYNNGCKLPCWWGITPGVTTWGDARNFLMQFDEVGSIEENHTQPLTKNPSKFTHAIFRFTSPGFNRPEGTKVDFEIQNGIVVAMALMDDLSLRMFDMNKLYTNYGPPDKIVMVPQDCSQDSKSCWASMFYMYDEGFLSQSGADGTVHDTTVSLCIPPWDSGLIYTWAHGTSIDLTLLSGKSDLNFIPLDNTDKKQISEFYAQGKYASDSQTCFDVPLDLWK